jgi:cephalosporin hydroxylase
LTIADTFFRNCTIESDIYEHLGYFVDTCKELDAARVIELGVRDGVSTTAWLYGLLRTDGRLWSVDIQPAPPIESDWWTFIQGSDTDPAVFRQLPDSVDVVFIDTSHTYEHTLAELAMYAPLVRTGGRILLHDTEVEHPDFTDDHDFPVKRAVELFCQANRYVWSNRTNNNGLATIEV